MDERDEMQQVYHGGDLMVDTSNEASVIFVHPGELGREEQFELAREEATRLMFQLEDWLTITD